MNTLLFFNNTNSCKTIHDNNNNDNNNTHNNYNNY